MTIATRNADGSHDGFTVTENPDGGRFEMHRHGELVAWADYSERDGVVTIPHVQTVVEFRGQGFGGRIVDGVMDILRDTDRTVVPLCGFAAGHIQSVPEYHDLLAAR